ncbi:MAG TPA: proline racemase family protein [Thermomicrobiales bacterium]|nr:proline racemase family protein [Thermomicrobiales bacterium]
MQVRRVFSTIDAHGGGQPLRIITSGVPHLQGGTYRARREYLRQHHDSVRTLLLHEPRGHADMYGAVLLTPTIEGADFGVVFMTNEGYSTMCGHGIIALTTALIDTGAVAVQEGDTRITFETPAGLINARASVSDGRVRDVRFRNVPAFRLAAALPVNVNGIDIPVDVSYGGAWYAQVDAARLEVNLAKTPVREIAALGMAVKAAVSNAIDVVHPDDPDISGLYGTTFFEPRGGDGLTLRTATIYARGAVDRSPCGTGTSALVASLAADGRIGVGDTLVNEGPCGTVFTGRVVVSTNVGQHPAVVTEIAGRGAVTGLHQFLIDPDDQVGNGFLLR